MKSDPELKNLLIDCTEHVARTTRISEPYLVKHMGATHVSVKYSKGWYVFIQNFSLLPKAKSSNTDQLVRFIFRIVQIRNDPNGVLLQVLV
jgi:hypothetical protein